MRFDTRNNTHSSSSRKLIQWENFFFECWNCTFYKPGMFMGLRLDRSKNTPFYSCPHHCYSKFKVLSHKSCKKFTICSLKIVFSLTHIWCKIQLCSGYMLVWEFFCICVFVFVLGVGVGLEKLVFVVFVVFVLGLVLVWFLRGGFCWVFQARGELLPPSSSKYRHHQTLNISSAIFAAF